MSIKRVTPILVVEKIEVCLDFWDRIGFQKTMEVPHGDQLGFVGLQAGSAEVMLQSRASVKDDNAALEKLLSPSTSALFVEVEDLDAIAERIEGVEIVVPRRQTFYGMDELGVREPGGHLLVLAEKIDTAKDG